MRSARTDRWLIALAATLAWLGTSTLLPRALRGDEPGGRFGRLFRFGSPAASRVEPESFPEPRMAATPRRPGPAAPAPLNAPTIVDGPAHGSPGSVPGPGLPPPTGPGPRIVPQPRVSRAVTESDPLVSRTTLGRSDGGNLFGLFMQVFADGTVLDNDGVHHLGREGIRGVLEALESSDLFRGRGHCGGPPTDFIEQAHVVVYERSLGRLRANAFSYSGNTQGCDPSIRRLHTALDNLQMKLGQPAGAVSAPTSIPAPASEALGPIVGPAASVPGAVLGPGVTISPASAPPPPVSNPSTLGPVVAPPVLGPISTPGPTTAPTIRLNEGFPPR